MIPEMTFFADTTSPFSQWHPSIFRVGNDIYCCTEQYMMFRKAKLFGDHATADQIMEEIELKDFGMTGVECGEDNVAIICDLQRWKKIPGRYKRLGRQVANFDVEQWNSVARTIVFAANVYKFSQNPHLKQALLDTGNTLLVEAAPWDKVWGIGLSSDDPRAKDPSQWLGTNWLGQCLMQVRDVMRAV